MIKLYNGDCLSVMQQIRDKTINLIVTDPPYNINKAEWDKIKNYVEWCGNWLKECERVLTDNGTLCFFHNDMPQIAQLMEWIRLNSGLKYNSFIIWDKQDFRALSWKNPSEKNTLRSWFNVCEYCLVYVKGSSVNTEWDKTGLQRVKLDINNFTSLRKYAYLVLCYIGGGNQLVLDTLKKLSEAEKRNTFSIVNLKTIPDKPKKKAMEQIGGKIDHFTRYGSTQWDLCTPETYQELIEKFKIDKMVGFREYESLRQEYESLRQEYESLRQEYESLRYTHNLDNNHNNVWKSKEKRNTGKLHPTQKPVDILERIIKTSSNSGDIVLDCFMGSGSTGVACKNTNRNFIGIELDKNYFKIAEQRILSVENVAI